MPAAIGAAIGAAGALAGASGLVGAGTAAAIGAGGALLGAVGSSSRAGAAAKSGGQAVNAASQQAAALQHAQYLQTREDLSPYRDAGANALGNLQYGLGTSGWPGAKPGDPWPADYGNLVRPFGDTPAGAGIVAGGLVPGKPFDMSPEALAQTPGYKFNLQQGLQAAQNSAAARGLGVSGAALRSAADYATGLADSTWKDQANNYYTGQNNYYNAANNYYAGQNNIYNKLAGLAGMGQSSAASTGYYGSQLAQSQGNNLIGGAQAQAAGDIGQARSYAGIAQAGQGLYNNYLKNKIAGMYANDSGGMTPGGVSLPSWKMTVS